MISKLLEQTLYKASNGLLYFKTDYTVIPSHNDTTRYQMKAQIVDRYGFKYLTFISNFDLAEINPLLEAKIKSELELEINMAIQNVFIYGETSEDLNVISLKDMCSYAWFINKNKKFANE